MTLDGRGRRAGEGFRHDVDDLTATDPDRGSFERFEAFRRRKQRNQRVGAGIVAGAVALVAIVFSLGAPRWRTEHPRVSRRRRPDPLRRLGRAGTTRRLVHGVSRRIELTRPRPLGDLCPSGSRTGAGSSPRTTPRSNQVRPCARRSSNRTAPAFGPWTPRGTRTSTSGAATFSRSSPDRARRVRQGRSLRTRRHLLGPRLGRRRSHPARSGAGLAAEVLAGRHAPELLRYDGGDQPHGIGRTVRDALGRGRRSGPDHTVGIAFGDHAWSPDGSWIVFQRPYGQLYLVRPDGSDLHRVPVELPSGTGD